VLRPEELRIEFFAATEGLVHAHSVRRGEARGVEPGALASGPLGALVTRR
jgi:hypothetical protein